MKNKEKEKELYSFEISMEEEIDWGSLCQHLILHCRKDEHFINEKEELMIRLCPRMFLLENLNSKMVKELAPEGGTDMMWQLFEGKKQIRCDKGMMLEVIPGLEISPEAREITMQDVNDDDYIDAIIKESDFF